MPAYDGSSGQEATNWTQWCCPSAVGWLQPQFTGQTPAPSGSHGSAQLPVARQRCPTRQGRQATSWLQLSGQEPQRPAQVLAIGWGAYATLTTPLDALPDLSDVQVIIRTMYPGQAPQVVENQVTYPLTTTMIAGRFTACAGPVVSLLFLVSGVEHVAALFGPCMLIGVGNGLTMPSANSGAMSVRPDLAGSASGLTGATTVAGGAALSHTHPGAEALSRQPHETNSSRRGGHRRSLWPR